MKTVTQPPPRPADGGLKHRAAVLTAPGRIELQDHRIDAPGPHEVRIRVDGCGVCGSDLAVWEGRDWFRYPLAPGAPGHEAWGTVESVGDRVTDTGLRPGKSVAGLFSGGFAEFAVAPAAHVVPVPGEAVGQPLPAEAIGCAVNAAGRAAIRPGDHVAVVGIGFQGALLVQLARAAGAEVTAVSRRAFACDLGERMGARQAVQASQKHEAGEVLSALDGDRDGFDVVFEATGRQESLDLATGLVRTRGRLVVAGYHQDPRSVDMQQWNWKGIDVVNAHERDPTRYVEGMREGLLRVAHGDLDLRPLITHTYGLDEAHEAFRAMERREDGFVKGVVRP